MSIYEKLKYIRKQYRLTQQEMADELGISRAHYTNLEGGKIKFTELLLRCVALRFDVSLDWLCDDTQTEEHLNKPTYTLKIEREDVVELAKKLEKLDSEYLKLVSQMIDGLLELQENSK